MVAVDVADRDPGDRVRGRGRGQFRGRERVRVIRRVRRVLSISLSFCRGQ